jgi:hypothetical protein
VTEATVNHVTADGIDDEAPPPGTAIVRPLRHVQAVRQRYSLRFADPAEAAAARAARAWAWALGETATAPVTDRPTSVPPGRFEIEAEIAVADERRLRGDREDRADVAATILRWLIGEDDHVPIRDNDRGELVGGFGEVVRSLARMADVLAVATEERLLVAAQVQESAAERRSRQFARQDTDYLDGVIATLAWVLGQHPESPITQAEVTELTARVLKTERVHAEDVTEQAGQPWMTDRLSPARYAEGVKITITWLLADTTVPPVDSAGRDSSG